MASASITLTLRAPINPATYDASSEASSWERDPTLPDTDNASLSWLADPNATRYNTYRDSIPEHGLGDRQRTGPIYDQICFEAGDGNGGVRSQVYVTSFPSGAGNSCW